MVKFGGYHGNFQKKHKWRPGTSGNCELLSVFFCVNLV